MPLRHGAALALLAVAVMTARAQPSEQPTSGDAPGAAPGSGEDAADEAAAAAEEAAIQAERAAAARAALEPELPTEMRALFTLVVNSVSQGEVLVVLRDDDVLVRAQDLADAGLRKLPGGVEEIDGEAWRSMRALSPPLKYELDENEITLRIVAPAQNLPLSIIDLAGKPADIEYSNRTSAFVNYAPHITDFERVDVYGETGLSIEEDLLFTSVQLSTERRPVRGVSQLILNYREDRRRVTFGDALVTTGPLGAGGFVGGATLASAYDLDPYLVTAPRVGFEATTLAPATLDVYVNGARVQSEQINPGRVRLDNLEVGGGSGVATYVLRDVLGQEQTFAVPFYVSSSVLAQGLEEYTYSVGMVRERMGTESWSYGDPVFLGRHRLGVSDHVTLGARGETSPHVIGGGPAITFVTPIGQIEAEVGASGSRTGEEGLAGLLSYSYASRAFGAGVVGTVLSNRYATVDTAPEDDRASITVGAFQSLPIVSALSVSLQQRVSHMRDGGTGWRLDAQMPWHATRALTLILSGSRSKSQLGDHVWEVFLGLNVALQDHNVAVGGRITEGEPSGTAEISKSLPAGEGYSYRAGGLLAERSTAQAELQYQALIGRYDARYAYDGDEHHLTLDAAGALVVVPGVGVFPTLPVQNAFGIIRTPGVEGVRGYVNNAEYGRTDAQGNLVVPNLLSQYGNRMGIEPLDVPIEYEVRATERTLAPPSRGVAVAEFPLHMPHFYRGSVVVIDAGKRVVPEYGELRGAGHGGEVVSPLTKEGEFELEGLEPGPSTLQVDYLDGTCSFDIDVPDGDTLIIELGELTCAR